MGSIITTDDNAIANIPQKPEIPSRNTEGYRALSKKVEEIKLEERIKEFVIL